MISAASGVPPGCVQTYPRANGAHVNDVELPGEVRKTLVDVIQFKCAIWGWVVYSTWGKVDSHYSSVGKFQSHCYCPVKSSQDQWRNDKLQLYTSFQFQNLRERVKTWPLNGKVNLPRSNIALCTPGAGDNAARTCSFAAYKPPTPNSCVKCCLSLETS